MRRLGTFELAVVAAELQRMTIAADELPAHPWIPRDLILSETAEVEAGSIVTLASPTGGPLGTATWNPVSHAPLRLLSRSSEVIDVNWFVRRFQECLGARSSFVANGEAFRWVYGEADSLPGLVIDRYGDAVAVQVRSLAMERCKHLWLGALASFSLSLVVERSDFSGRRAEGLEPYAGVLQGSGSTVRQVKRGGLQFEVDLLNGPKTGFYLDQLTTSQRLRNGVRSGDRVADIFCSVGQLSIAAASVGGQVTAVDIDPVLGATVDKNAALNGVAIDFVAANAFEWLEGTDDHAWNWIILDPPPIAKHRGQRRSLLGAIYKLARLAIPKLAKLGHLVICSCSHQVTLNEIQKSCMDALKDAGRRRIAQHSWGQPADHPCPAWFPEAKYLNVAEFILE